MILNENIKALGEALPQLKWCIWKAVDRGNGKVGKVPHAVVNGKTKTIGSDTVAGWGSFADVCNWVDVAGDGVGILIGSNPTGGKEPYSSGLVAIDIDGCFSSVGEFIPDLPQEIHHAYKEMVDAGCYIEVSPSGRGLRALYVGSKPSGLKEKAQVGNIGCELYGGMTKGRFVTLTGNLFKPSTSASPSPPTLPESFTASLSEWLGLHVGGDDDSHEGKVRDLTPMTDEAIIAKIKQSKQGKGKRLFEGDLSDYGGDESSGDAGLCRAIARYTDDATQVLRIWSASALSKRPKFDRKDYRNRTISSALNAARKDAALGLSGKEANEKKLEAGLTHDVSGEIASILKSNAGKIPNTLGGIVAVIANDNRLAGCFAYCEFIGQVVKLRSLKECIGERYAKDKAPILGDLWGDNDTASLTLFLEYEWGVKAKTSLVHEAIQTSSRLIPINTVVDKLNSLVWDGVKRLDTWLIQYMNADTSIDTKTYLAEIGKRWLIGAVRRAYVPGTKQDQILTAFGGQGYGKSNAFKALACSVAPFAYMEGLPALSMGQEAERSLIGSFICEMAELAVFDRATAELVKQFTTKTQDTVRAAYGRTYFKAPRTVSFVATTNQSQFCRDPSGARRWWGFTVKSPINVRALEDVALQLFAEAVVLHKAGEPHWLTSPLAIREAEIAQRKFIETAGWDELIAEYILDPLVKGDGEAGTDYSFFDHQALTIWRMIPSNEVNDFSKHAKAFSDALTRTGFVKRNSHNRSIWRIGSELERQLIEAQKGRG